MMTLDTQQTMISILIVANVALSLTNLIMLIVNKKGEK